MFLRDTKRTTNEITGFLKEVFQRAGFTNAVIGLSGGVDSAISCALAVRALGPSAVFPILLPYGTLNAVGVAHAQEVIKTLGIPQANVAVVNIMPHVNSIVSTDPSMDHMRKGNVMARVRMIFLFDHAKRRQGLVVGTENKTEHLLGYYTRFGDEASDIEPLRGLYKTQVYEIAKFLGLPDRVLTQAPTAGLWVGQTDEAEFGFSYKEADEILLRFVDEHISEQAITQEGYDTHIVSRIIERYQVNLFKHHLPYIPFI